MQAACVALLLPLLARAYATRPMPFNSQRFRKSAQSSDVAPRRVQCYSDSNRPPTYCLLLWGQNDNITGDEAQKRCQDIGMKLLSSETTTRIGLCVLMAKLNMKPQRIWWTDRLNQVHLDKFDHDYCWYNKNAEQTVGDHAVVCHKSIYYSEGGSCVTFQEGPDDVEYCFFNERVPAFESAARCAEKSSLLLDPSQLHQTEMLEYARNLVRTNLEFWVDTPAYSIGYVSGAFTDSSSYAIRCNTVRFGPTVPSFFEGDCSQSHPIICEQSTSLTDNRSPYVNNKECAYRKTNSGNFSYCIPEGRTFSLSAGREFCEKRGLVLLRESTLRKVHGLYDLSLPEDVRDMDGHRIWEAGFKTEGNMPPGYCTATNLVKMMPEKQSLPCSHQLGYICRKRILAQCDSTNRAQPSFAPGEKTIVSMPQMCISYDYFTYQDSVEYCKQRNKTLLSERIFSGEEEKVLLNQYKGHGIWVVPTGGGVTRYATPCESGVIQMDADCSQTHRAVCTSDNRKDPTETAGPLHKCYGCQNPTLGRTGVSLAFKNALNDIGYDEHLQLGEKFYLDEIFWPTLSNVMNAVRSTDDFEALPYLLAKSLETFNKLVLCRSEEDQKEYNKNFGHTVVDIVENTMLKSKILQAIDEERRILTASCLFNIVEDIALQKNLTRSR